MSAQLLLVNGTLETRTTSSTSSPAVCTTITHELQSLQVSSRDFH